MLHARKITRIYITGALRGRGKARKGEERRGKARKRSEIADTLVNGERDTKQDISDKIRGSEKIAHGAEERYRVPIFAVYSLFIEDGKTRYELRVRADEGRRSRDNGDTTFHRPFFPSTQSEWSESKNKDTYRIRIRRLFCTIFYTGYESEATQRAPKTHAHTRALGVCTRFVSLSVRFCDPLLGTRARVSLSYQCRHEPCS